MANSHNSNDQSKEWKTYKIQSGYTFYNIRAKNVKQAKRIFKKDHNKVIDSIEEKF